MIFWGLMIWGALCLSFLAGAWWGTVQTDRSWNEAIDGLVAKDLVSLNARGKAALDQELRRD